jgi:hypothetical protein
MKEKTQHLLEQLATKFGTTVEHLWNILIYQAKIEGILYIVSIIVFSVICIFELRWYQKLKIENSLWSEEKEQGAFILTLIIYTILVIIIFCGLPYVITCFYNPEYWALKQLI